MIDVPPEPAVVVQADVQRLYESAVADRLAGRPADAVPKLEQVLRARPQDVDARLQLGLALIAVGRLDQAEVALRRVLDAAPAYTDAKEGLARIEARRRAEAVGRWRLEAWTARSRLSGGLPDWTETRVSLSRRLGETWSGAIAVEATERFGVDDTYVEARVDKTMGAGAAYVAVGGAFDADYRPKAVLLAGGQAPVARGFAITLDGSVARYGVGVVTGLHPGVSADLVDGRLTLAARWINVWDENDEYRNGYAAFARWQASRRVALRVAYADAPESSDGSTVEVSSWSAGADIDLSDRLVLRLGLLSEDRQAYDREALSVGLGWRF